MNIVYIDDEQTEINSFKSSILLVDMNVTITGIQPLYSLEETYELVMSGREVDAVVTDYELSDSCDVSFTGADLVKELKERQPFLSCFVLTAFEDNAVKSDSVDVYQVYPKSVLDKLDDTSLEHEVSFYDRLQQQVEKNKRRLISLTSEYQELIKLRDSTSWTSEKESRLIDLDSLLDLHAGGEQISRVLKQSNCTSQIIELIEVTKDLLSETKNG
ncbi:response regulator [Pseudoalteromonas rubra]|uniref:Response regulatory domain-containing protein n=1 Tax=Pseudoalteromonas rubra TaxID=43658 RepID=A0A5S3X2N5_9GAMM|nr:response regulator [Pseudoalteromonas rubra]TMP38218.1 hypothetical protein CWB98_07830 [Pseudoalteromonas rubra]